MRTVRPADRNGSLGIPNQRFLLPPPPPRVLPQGLTKLHNLYNSQGLEILAFPCNQFGAQEPKPHAEILEFAKKYDGADKKFNWFAKGDVNGKNTMEVFSFLKTALKWDDGSRDVKWNFGKFVVGADGVPVERFGSKQHPMEMEEVIVAALDRASKAEK